MNFIQRKVLPKRKSTMLSRNIKKASENTMAIMIGKTYNAQTLKFHRTFNNAEINLAELEQLRDYIEIFFDETKHFPSNSIVDQIITKVKSENLSSKIPILNLLN